MRELEQGEKYPYHGQSPKDWAERAALGVLYDLNDRRGIKHALADVDAGVRAEIVETLAGIIRAARPEAAVIRVLFGSDPYCPSCGHDRNKSSVSSINNEDGTRSCQMCGIHWREIDSL